MNLRDLQYVVRVADLGHFGRAAAACHVSQPTLSGQILKLEQELGLAIFERSGRQIRLTRAGEKIVAEARRATEAARTIAAIAAANRDPLVGDLRIGVIPTIAPYLVPALLPRARGDLPDAPLTFVEDVTDDILAPLNEGDLDGAVVATEFHGDRLTSIPLFREPLFVLMPAGHRLAAKVVIRPEDIDPKSLLLLNEGHCLRDHAMDFCGHPDLGRGAIADTRATSLETLLHLTVAGYGVTIVPALAVALWSGLSERVVARPLAGAYRDIRLAHRRDAPRQAALERLADILRESAPA